ncbi:hypothetical protein [Oscillatoria sp. HE19RPO]|uniref:hypothetical protein n=1 Tax=Oscillatoria sp. HE19RPO TaxID=2954806 RepID=UPI0020C2CEF2|nr:hypothetical protein [Oscillatoria sp. HE19RPO]
MNTKFYWRKLRTTAISPYFHGLFLRNRFLSNFVTSPLYRRAMAIIWVSVVVVVVTLTHTWFAFLVAWVFPLTILYQISALLQFTSEHRWLVVPGIGKPAIARKSLGRFMGETPPDAPFSEQPREWLLWLLRMLGYHLPARIAVISGELPEHDWHHRHPNHKDWANGVYHRQRDIEAGCPNWPEEYTEVWGLFNAVDCVFKGLSQMPPAAEEPKAIDLNAIGPANRI